jgi:hypothetical protein
MNEPMHDVGGKALGRPIMSVENNMWKEPKLLMEVMMHN